MDLLRAAVVWLVCGGRSEARSRVPRQGVELEIMHRGSRETCRRRWNHGEAEARPHVVARLPGNRSLSSCVVQSRTQLAGDEDGRSWSKRMVHLIEDDEDGVGRR